MSNEELAHGNFHIQKGVELSNGIEDLDHLFIGLECAKEFDGILEHCISTVVFEEQPVAEDILDQEDGEGDGDSADGLHGVWGRRGAF
jgi:hypothetical protein